MILAEEGLEAVWARHAVFARAVWAAVEAWGAGGALALNIADAALAQPRGHHHPHRARATARGCAAGAPTPPGVTLGIGLSVPGVDPDSIFRIGHMGHLNPPMLLGTLATIEAGFRALGIRHGRAASRRRGR